mgnify:CR=1 FL=1|tara:strand:+ start:577 stop:1440 length:864 start_codon:yes stop_codon:yes gene_type:complete
MSREAVAQKIVEKIFGTVDRVIITGKHVDVVDFKFGRGAIDDADINIQGQAYLLGVMDKYPELETATVHFIIPRRDEVFTHDYTRADMEDIRLRISLIVELATQETPDLRPNTEGCRYCKHKLTCEALSDKLLPIAKKYDKAVGDFELNLWGSYEPAEILDPDMLSKMLNVSQVVDRWAEAVKRQALKLAIEEGLEIPGYDLHFRNASLKIKNGQDAYDALEHLLTPEEFMEVCSVSITALAKIYGSKLPRGEKKNARGRIEQELESAGVLPAEENRDRSPYLRKKR